MECCTLPASLCAVALQAPKSEFDVPRVSPYRLAAHLGSAFAIYAVLMWSTLTLAQPLPVLTGASAAALAAVKRLRGVVHPLAALIAVTAISGAARGRRVERSWCTF